MRKLYLASFDFKTNKIELRESRIVVVTNDDRIATKHAIEVEGTYNAIESVVGIYKEGGAYDEVNLDLAIAYDKMKDWFPTFYKESELLSLTVFPAVE